MTIAAVVLHAAAYAPLTQFGCIFVGVENIPRSCLISTHTIILEHAVVYPRILSLNRYGCLGGDGIKNVVVVAMWAVLVGILKLTRILSEALLALLARENHLEALQQLVVLLLLVALGAIEPFLATR